MDNEYKNEEPTGDSQEPRGPQFDDSAPQETIYERIANAKNSGWGKDVNEFTARHRATLIPLASLVLAVALGLGAVALLNNNDSTINLTTDEPSQEEQMDNEPTAPEAGEEPQDPGESIDEPTLDEPTVSDEGEMVVAVAEPGDGITHLARAVIIQRLEQSGRELSAEQLVYAEDYLQNEIGSYGLAIGEEVHFSSDDIESAIDSSLALEQWQIDSLERFTE